MNTPSRLARRIFLRGAAFLCAFRLPAATPAPAATPPGATRVREPAVAGLFYPDDPAALSKMIDACLAGAKTATLDGELKALICPHAGYQFSGPVAGSAYRLLEGRSYSTVVVMGPTHYAFLRGASVTNAAVFRTPLGDVPISAKAAVLAQSGPFALEPRCEVQRPDWWLQSPLKVPAVETADTWEHSVEVEIPFLQKTLKNFELVTVVCGEVDEEKAATALQRILDDRTLIVASSDLSHYHPYSEARSLDQRTVDAICRLDPDAIGGDDACGHTPIGILLHIAKRNGWKARVLDLRNSGDTAGGKSAVVGYAAIAFYAPAVPAASATSAGPATPAAPASSTAPAASAEPARETFTAADRRFLLELARKTVREVASGGKQPTVPTGGLDPKFTAHKGCFVTLTKHGALRGCIGYIFARGPLIEAVIENARNAALDDPRFPPVSPDEVNSLEIEISVLTKPEPLAFDSSAELLEKLKPHEDGVVLQIGGRGATYLPQVWDQLPDKEEFLNNLAEKAGCDRPDWRLPGTTVLIYHVEAFKESELPGTAKPK